MTQRDGLDTLSMAGRSALITGAASGIGQASALLMAAYGAHIVIVDRDESSGKATVDTITDAGGSAESHAVDLSDAGQLEEFLDVFTSNHASLDVLFNHAGVTGPPRLEYDKSSWDETMTVNLWVPMRTTQRLLPLLRKAGSASVICTASAAGLAGKAPLPTYAASKAALINFVKSCAIAVASEGIRINAICPGATDTPALRRDLDNGTLDYPVEEILKTIPMRRLATTTDMANLALFLASDASSFITGTAIAVDGGTTA